MLRISKIEFEKQVSRLRLDGRLSGPWVDELRRSCEADLEVGHELIVDCAGLTFADAEGIALLRWLREQNVTLENCSPFVKLQLEEASV